MLHICVVESCMLCRLWLQPRRQLPLVCLCCVGNLRLGSVPFAQKRVIIFLPPIMTMQTPSSYHAAITMATAALPIYFGSGAEASHGLVLMRLLSSGSIT